MDDVRWRGIRTADEFRAAALAELPDLASLSRARLTALLREYSDACGIAYSILDRAWWATRVEAVQAELKGRPHGKPRTRARGR